MRANATGLSDVGLQREHNEDSFVVLNEYDLFIVADGMGGHRAGDVASRLATETIADFFKSTASEDVTWPFHFDTSLSEEENRLLTGIRIANRQIFERSAKSRECRGMGTTVVGALFSPRKNRMYIGHVGDSRCYRVRRGEVRQMTRDHSLINDYLIAMPDLTEEQKSELPKNVITRALGMQDQVMVDLQSDEPQIGDMYLLCSDGLSGMIADDEILDILMSTGDIVEGCRRLVARANEHGGEDNITAVLVRIDEGISPNLASSSTSPPPSGEEEATFQGPLPPVVPKAMAEPAVVASPVQFIESESTLPSGTAPTAPPGRSSGRLPGDGNSR
ncbi:MAG TPA: Stp1/IreP family PP2C-type Ser/Thr phosphatase [Polyangiaceae bacterium]|nr:Stp1/IreP family PP2C-type Ser/Thr phosphatase [Polyangiaceae bacterium]